jgi:hypothetical protein
MSLTQQGDTTRTLRTPAAALALFFLLAVAHTWPLASQPSRLSLNHNADAQQVAWTLAWIARTLPTDPYRLFDTNIFAPETGTLAYSDPMMLPALAGAPVWWLGGSAVLTFNVALLLGLTFTGWCGWLLARRWTGSDGAAAVAGALVAFNAHTLTRLPHIVAAYLGTVVLALYFADRLVVDHRDRRAAVGLALATTLTAITSLYGLALAGVGVALSLMVAGLWRRWHSVLTVSVASLGGVLLALPILWPYAELASTGARRPIESVAQFSATLSGYLATPGRIHSGWSGEFYTKDVSVFFAGFTALALAALGLAFSSGQASRPRRTLAVALAIVGVVLSLGPATSVFRVAYEWLVPLQGLRAAARFGYLYLIAVAMLAAYGLVWIEHRWSPPRTRRVVAAVAVALVTAEAWTAPIQTTAFEGVPPIYRQLATMPEPVLLAEIPFWPPEVAHRNAEYELHSTVHWRPLANGASGLTPLSYRRRADPLWYFPDRRAFDAITREGITHVMVHREHFAPHEVAAIDAVMREQAMLRLIATDSLGHQLYEVERGELRTTQQ